MTDYIDSTPEELESVMQEAWKAFPIYKKCTHKQRADFLRAIAKEIEHLGDALIQTAVSETQLTEARLRNERTRTIFQLTSYGDACEKGDWLDVKIDQANPNRNPPKPDLRKMMIPLGPVVVFGAANFPFAYSTAGGDTATALAAGCPVVVKAHPAHAATSEMVAGAIAKAARDTYMPTGVFAHVHGASRDVGQFLVEHPYTSAVGFTGSFAGGKQLFDWANQRKVPIPVFAEMSSINPVFLLPEKIQQQPEELAVQLAQSITLGVGQFCTNPGLIIGIDNNDLLIFQRRLAEEMVSIPPGDMLNAGIFKNYVEKRANALAQEEVEMVGVADANPQFNQAVATIACTSASTFLKNPLLHQEVFGPFSLIVRCRDIEEMLEVALHLEGQLTSTLMATTQDIRQNDVLVEAVKNICGRLILNNVPTGVEVALSMQHGGPFPATTDSRFSSVGADGIRRFTRPITYQNWSDELLPDELKQSNPLGIKRVTTD